MVSDSKSVFNFEKESFKNVQFGDQVIRIKTFLSVEDIYIIISRYIFEMFSKKEYDIQNILRAENSLIISLIELCTDIPLVNDSGNSYFMVDDVLANYGLVELIKDNIENWSYFHHTVLYKTIQEEVKKREYEQSVSYKLEEIFNRAVAFLESLQDNNLSEEKFSQIRLLLKEIDDSPLLKKISENIK